MASLLVLSLPVAARIPREAKRLDGTPKVGVSSGVRDVDTMSEEQIKFESKKLKSALVLEVLELKKKLETKPILITLTTAYLLM